MCSSVLVRYGGALLSADWAWTWGKGWGKSCVLSVCWVGDELVLGNWIMLLWLPVWVGAAMWWSGSLEAWEHKRECCIRFISRGQSKIEAQGAFWEHCVLYSDAVWSFRLPIWEDVIYSFQIVIFHSRDIFYISVCPRKKQHILFLFIFSSKAHFRGFHLFSINVIQHFILFTVGRIYITAPAVLESLC